ncbi:MAG: repeat-containing protein YfgC precursor [Planctomycetota bacterium]|jgi:predicted Zn-dependent protease
MRLLLLAAVLTALVACATVDGTGRSQMLLTSPAQENELGAKAYAEIKAKERRSDDPVATALIERVGGRLAAVAPGKGFQYEFLLIESPTINAFCLPGGKVAFYTGILGWCGNEAAVAAVMGHEIGHAIARHGGERMSQQMAAGVAGGVLAAALQAKGVQPTTRTLSMAAFGLGSQLGVMLPFSRHHETEADELGLMYMAQAGYDPEEAVRFWTRFGQLTSGTPSFLSTHPASADRAAHLQALLPKAKALYAAAPRKHGLGETLPARYKAEKPR